MPDQLTEAQVKATNLMRKAGELVIELAGPTPNLGNLTATGAVDIAGLLNDARKKIEQAEKTYKEILKTKLEGRPELRGEAYEMSYSPVVREALNQGRAKDKILQLGSQEDLDSCMDVTEVPTMRFKAL